MKYSYAPPASPISDPAYRRTQPQKNLRPWMLFLLSLLLFSGTLRAATLPDGFAETRLAANLDPTSFNFAPDGRLFITEKNGRIRIIKNGVLLSTPFLTLSNVDNLNERGLQSIAFDPNFQSNGYVYVYYAVLNLSRNRVSRFTANGDVAVGGSETIILDLNQFSGSIHNGGAMFFKDGKLFIATGEGGNYYAPQQTTNLLGKVLRINPDGTIPTDNPFYNTASGVNRAIYASGFRNPFKMDVQPGTGRIFVNDVGQMNFEEVNELVSGKNYGWPFIEGKKTTQSPPANYKDPIYAYSHSEGGCAITGGTFYNPTTSQFPTGYVGKYFFSDYCWKYIKTLDVATGAVAYFASNVPRPIDIKVGPDGALYYLTRGSGNGSVEDNTSSSVGEVWRVSYTASQSPSISAQPSNVTVSVGGSATFSVSASGTAPFAYQWQRNGTDIPGATTRSYTRTNVALTDNGALFRARVTNSFGTATSNAATLTVINDQVPTGSITSPVSGSKYNAAQNISFSGTGTDPEDGSLPASAFTWWVDFVHDDDGLHTHPVLPPTEGITSGSFTTSSSVHGVNVWYRIYLKVTDSEGQSTTTYRDIYPNKISITLASVPSGLQLRLDGQTVTAPHTYQSIVGATESIEAVSPQTLNGTTYSYTSWSDGGAQLHNLTIPAANTTYTATYTGSSVTLRTPENPANTVNGIAYAYYEGNWTALPNFASLTPVKTGTLANFNLSPRNRDNYYAFRYTGYIEVPTDGVYTFYTYSDDGSRLYIGNTLVVDNDGLHPPLEKSGSIGLKAGKHAFTVAMFEQAGGEVIQVSYQSAALAKQLVPAAALFRIGATTLTLEAENAVRSGVAVSTIHPGFTGTGFGDYVNASNDYIEWTANVPTAGNYTLQFRYALNTLAGRPLAIRVNGVTVQASLPFNPTGSWTNWQTVSLNANLNAGNNTIRATATGSSGANLDHLRVTPVAPAPGRTSYEDIAAANPPESVVVYPVPATSELTIQMNNIGKARIRIADAQGKTMAPQVKRVQENQIVLNVTGFKTGLYFLLVHADGKTITKKISIQR